MDRLVASWFGTGLILGRMRGSHAGSGTVGALAALLVAYPAGIALGWVWQLGLAAAVVAAGFWSSSRLVGEVGDAGWIVVDEAAGVFISLIGLTDLTPVIVAFVVFRAADILKTWFPGVAAVDRRHGAVGIMGDDIVASLYGLAAGHIVAALT